MITGGPTIGGPTTGGLVTCRWLHVERTGPLTTVQDLGRPGWAHLGVPRSGAADRSALRRANRLVGNVEGAAALEVLLGGLAVRVEGHVTAAVCGADCGVRLDGRPLPRDAVLDLPPGGLLSLDPAAVGLRAYLAVRGGLAVPAVLGSRSRDTLAGLGPEPLRAGDELPVGDLRGADVAGWPTVAVAPVAGPPDPDEVAVLRARPGPRAAWLDPAAAAALWTVTWEVSAESDRVGIRLRGPVLGRAAAFADVEPASEGMVRGAVQVPPSGQPVLFLADHPVTGGYPVAAVVLDPDVDRAAQLRPGQGLRLGRAPIAERPVRPGPGCSWWGW